MPNKQALNLLGLAKRAGKLETGEGFVLKAITKSTAKLVFVAQDASENTRKKITDKSSFYQVPVQSPFTAAELSDAIGAKRSLIAVTDAGFAQKLIKLLT
ncbi:YlxQ-related RNA-binding protein [Lacticaseibacillus saniviri]|nr:YlxQ-related RNA-binding protein [Lacticaseibacillus saniviri]MCG4281890.1 YlxQ-related RNA-binding protein [Lacticaseibacillus saniviri]